MRARSAFLAASLLAVAAAAPADAAQKIGGATAVQREVSGNVEGRTRAIASGDDVHQNELIRTGGQSFSMPFASLGSEDRRASRLRKEPAQTSDGLFANQQNHRGRAMWRLLRNLALLKMA
jgi:hypothetical protein